MKSIDSNQIYEICPLHPKQWLQVVCLECEINSIACPLCIDLSHKNHSMISLKKFTTTEIPKLYTKKPDHKIVEKGISELGTTYQSYFQKMRKSIGYEINQLQKMYQGQIEALHIENNVVCGVGAHIYTPQNISLLKKKIKNNQKIPDMKVFNLKIRDLCQKMQCLIGQLSEDICEMIRGLTNFWQASKELLLNSKREFKFLFSTTLKHKALTIEVNNWRGKKLINQLYDNSFHIGVVEPPLNPFKNEIQFRVQKSQNRCVWLGVCDLKKIIDKRFLNCYKKGEGAYWIWQGGCKGGAQFFSNLSADSQILPWNFDIGDIVKIRIIFEKNNRYVEFEKNKNKIFRGKLEKANVYCACVAMGAQDESVVIIEE